MFRNLSSDLKLVLMNPNKKVAKKTNQAILYIHLEMKKLQMISIYWLTLRNIFNLEDLQMSCANTMLQNGAQILHG